MLLMKKKKVFWKKRKESLKSSKQLYLQMKKTTQSIVKVFRIVCLLTFFIFGTLQSASKNTNDIPHLVPHEHMIHETRWLIKALEKAHFNKISVLDVNASEFLLNYLGNLDRQKLFFTQREIDNYLNRYTPTLSTYLSQGNLYPAFEIYSEYLSKAMPRLRKVSELIDKEIDLETDQSYYSDRQDANWSETPDDLDAIWQKIIKHDFIFELLSSDDLNISDDYDPISILENAESAKESIKKKYDRWIKNISDFESTDVQELYLTTLTQMFDPHTTFMNIKEREKFDQSMHNEFVGIGAVLTDEDGYCTIKELLPGGPAEASRQLQPEDIILKVAQGENEFVDVVNMKLSKIVELIKGPKDTLVRLEIMPIQDKASLKKVSIIREKIKLTANLATAEIHKIPSKDKERKLGVIKLPSFYGSSDDGPKATDDVEELIIKLNNESAEGLILDLRRNGGGYLSEAVNLAGLFISRGPVVQVKSTDGKIRKKFDFNPKLSWDKPLIVLTSRYSASASEIVAGALQNLNRAIVVGDKATHGKGTVQSLLPLNLPLSQSHPSGKKSAAKITIQKYYLPSGDSTQIKGVISDISMPSVNEFLPIGETDLDNALPWDKIDRVNFNRPSDEFYTNQNQIKQLKNLSMDRQNSNPEFKYLSDNIEIFNARNKRKSVSLNLSKRHSEKQKDKDVSDQQEDKYRLLSDLVTYRKNVTLDIVESQNLKSKAIRGESKSDISDFEKPDDIDVRLHESLRILSDWLELLESKSISQHVIRN